LYKPLSPCANYELRLTEFVTITTSIESIPNAVVSISAVLAQSAPKASNYFFSYFDIYTFGAIISNTMQIPTLINVGVLSPLFDRTPRQKWTREEGLLLYRWGNFIPTVYTRTLLV
jgi:calcium permeable stress-gated cation channel